MKVDTDVEGLQVKVRSQQDHCHHHGHHDPNKLPEARSFSYLTCLLLTIKLGGLNLGYVLSYLTLSIDTIFENLDIKDDERTFRLSLLNGIAPVGAFCGCLTAYFLVRRFTNKQCLFFADLCGTLTLLTIIPKYETKVAFRFFLGMQNGINSFIMPSQVKQLCPERYFSQFSMVIGYLSSTGLLIGQIMGVGYLSYRGKGSYWWMAVFTFPPIISILRTTLILCFFNFDSPEQLLKAGKDKEARRVIELIYQEESVQKVFDNYAKKVQAQPKQQKFTRIFTKIRHQRTVAIGVFSNVAQQWCGSFAVFYYGAQINKELAEGDLTMITVFTIAVGLCMFFPQFLNIPLSKKFGVKVLLQAGAFMIAAFNVVTVVFSSLEKDPTWLVMTLLFMLLLITTFSVILQPNTWSITAQLNEPDGAWFCMLCRWGVQIILIFSFPYVVNTINISGAFIIFACVCLLYGIFVSIYVKDTRGMTQKDIDEWYAREPQDQVMQLNEIEVEPQNDVQQSQMQGNKTENNKQ